MSPPILSPLPAARWNYATAAHLLNRAGFGGAPAEIASLQARGLDGAVSHLLNFSAARVPFQEPDWAKPDPQRGEKLKALRNAPATQRQTLRREAQQQQRKHLLELHHTWLLRMHAEGAPLQEKLTLFWHGHFATSAQKVKDAGLICRQNDLFRRHAAGHWPSLLNAITTDPAMLLYLDQADSKPGQPNENYARELMELFSLGEGHYSEQDVSEAARALTGLAYDRVHQVATHRRRLKDARPKTLFQETGDFDEKDVVRLITRQPAAAPFITGKLWNFFAGTDPSPALAAALATEFRRVDQQFSPFLVTLFRSAAFYAPEVQRRQIKSPVQLLIGACRHLERDLPPAPIAHNSLRMLGQELFNPPNVKGWDGGIAWINTNTLLTRHNLALLLTTGENPLPAMGKVSKAPRTRSARARPLPASAVSVDQLFAAADRQSPESLVSAVERRLFQGRTSEQDRAALLKYVVAQGELDAQDLLGLLRLAMCTPDYQLT